MVFRIITYCLYVVLSIDFVVGQARPPRITEHPSDVLVRKLDPATLNCKAEGRPPPVIQWYHNGVLVRDSNSNRIILNDGSLFFLEVLHNKRDQYTGTYWCVATNELGEARSRNATVEVGLLREDFRVSPKTSLAAMGESTTLECNPPKGYPEPVVSWKKDGELLPLNKGRLRLVPPGSLVISDVQQSDEGQYVCIAENMAGTRETLPAHLSVHVKPFFVKEPEHVTVLSNADVEFECRVGGNPLPTITWYREDKTLPADRSLIAENKSLIIRSVTPADDGTYVCEAKNLVGTISSSVSLTVHSRPQFIILPKDQRVGLNGIAKFECVASGNPPPSIFWTKEGNQVLMFPERSYGRFSVTRDGTLVISGVKKDDRGYYICNVLSGIGSTMAKGYLEVTSVGDLPPPIINRGPANQTLPLNTVAMLPCEASGEPPPVTRWSVNSAQLNIENPRYVVLDSGTLQINAVQVTDSGVYTCTASSESGETSISATLSVESPLNPNAIFHRMPDPSAFPGPPTKPLILNVTETTVTLAWKRSQRIGSSSLIGYVVEYYSSDLQSGWLVIANRIPKETFTVKNLRPDTRYVFIIRAENSHGLSLPSPTSDVVKTAGLSGGVAQYSLDEVRSKLGLVVVFLQDAIPISSTSVKMLWKIQGPVNYVEGFYIRFRELSAGPQKYNMVTVLNRGVSSYTLSDLRKFTKYEFFLVPFYKSVEGPPSNSKTAQTLEDVPSAPPDDLRINVMGPTSGKIIWSQPPPQHQNGILQGYIVKVHDDTGHLHSLLTTNSSTLSITLTNLTSGAVYSIKVAAFTLSGTGPYSAPIRPKIDYVASTPYGKKPQSPSASDINEILAQPWFIALIASLVFVILSILFVILFIKRKMAWKKGLQAHLSAPVVKADDIRVGVSAREALWINQAWHPTPTVKSALNDNKMLATMNTGTERSYISGGTSDYAEVDTHNMTTFYKKDHPSVPAPYATTTLINPPPGHHSGSIHEGKSSGSDASKRSDRMYDMESRLIEDSTKEQLIEARNMVSPSSDSGSYTTDEYGLPVRRKRLKGGPKSGVVNWADLIPPPPDHPPSAGASPTATPSTVRNNFPMRNIRPQLPMDNGSNVSYSPSGVNRTHHLPNSNRQPQMNCSPWSTLSRPPPPSAGDPRRAPTPPALAGMKYPNVNTQRSLPQTFGSNPLMDRAVQSSLASLASDPHPGQHKSLMANHDNNHPGFKTSAPYYQYPPQQQSQSQGNSRYGVIIPRWCGDNNSAESSAAEDVEYAQGHAPPSSWTSATDRSNTSSIRSSVASSSDGSVYTDSDFVNAVARAAQNAGLQLLSPAPSSRLDNPSMSLLSPVNRC